MARLMEHHLITEDVLTNINKQIKLELENYNITFFDHTDINAYCLDDAWYDADLKLCKKKGLKYDDVIKYSLLFYTTDRLIDTYAGDNVLAIQYRLSKNDKENTYQILLKYFGDRVKIPKNDYETIRINL